MTAAVKQIAEYKLTVNDYFDLMMIWFRDVLYKKATNDVNGLIFKDEVYDIKKQAAPMLSVPQILRKMPAEWLSLHFPGKMRHRHLPGSPECDTFSSSKI